MKIFTGVPIPLAERFWSKVCIKGPHECWIWLPAHRPYSNYGQLWVPEFGRPIGAHVVSVFLHMGEWPPQDCVVRHRCPGGDTPACVNPRHLLIGTRSENHCDQPLR